MTTQKIYIHLIDGTDVWILINAKQLRDIRFEILEDEAYHKLNTDELFEFFPGDIVELEEHGLPDGTNRQVARKLISTGQWPDRKFNEFMYKAALNQLHINLQTVGIFQEQIERVKKEYAAGRTFYPTILETVNKLDTLIKRD